MTFGSISTPNCSHFPRHCSLVTFLLCKFSALFVGSTVPARSPLCKAMKNCCNELRKHPFLHSFSVDWFVFSLQLICKNVFSGSFTSHAFWFCLILCFSQLYAVRVRAIQTASGSDLPKRLRVRATWPHLGAFSDVLAFLFLFRRVYAHAITKAREQLISSFLGSRAHAVGRCSGFPSASQILVACEWSLPRSFVGFPGAHRHCVWLLRPLRWGPLHLGVPLCCLSARFERRDPRCCNYSGGA